MVLKMFQPLKFDCSWVNNQEPGKMQAGLGLTFLYNLYAKLLLFLHAWSANSEELCIHSTAFFQLHVSFSPVQRRV